MQRRCVDEACRRALWNRRVEAYVELSSSAESVILRIVYLHDALKLADQSNDSELREYAASALQTVRNQDLGLIRFEASSVHYEQEFEIVRDSFISESDWKEALVRFANAGPLSGDFDQNRALVAARNDAAPLGFLMPATLLGPDGLPLLSAVSPEEKLAYGLVRQETYRIQSFVRPLISALHTIVVRFGLPSTRELAEFLGGWPGMTAQALAAIVQSLQRFWGGDSEGATYILTPRIEALVRDLILTTNHGMFKLQNSHKPGQYPGLGAMLEILAEQFDISESWLRFLKVTLIEPAGFNLRNTLAHGVVDHVDPGAAAMAIQTALFLTTLRPKAVASTDQTPAC
jgi:hypothetical protein